MNLVGKFRSNYFAVKDRRAFEAWCQQNGLQLIVAESCADLVGFLNRTNEAGIPTIVLEECDGEEEEIEIDFIEELATFLADGHVAIVIEIFWEGYRYLGGTAYAINSRGEQTSLDLSAIMLLAEQLGEHVTRCEY